MYGQLCQQFRPVAIFDAQGGTNNRGAFGYDGALQMLNMSKYEAHFT